jgi:PKD repeat protein
MKNFIHYRRYLLVLVLWLSFVNTYSQVTVSHKEDWFFIENGTDVHIKGDYISLDGNQKSTYNLGNIYLDGNITCNGDNLIFGLTPDSLGAVFLNGYKTQTFNGTKNMRFGTLYINNSYDSLHLNTNVDIYKKIELLAGNIDIQNYVLDLLHTGFLTGETNAKRIYSASYGQIHLNQPLISGTTYTDIAGIGLDLTINGNLGTGVDIYRRNHQQVNVSNGSIDRYYYFNPAQNGYVSKFNIHYLDSNEFHGNDENLLGLFTSQSSGSTWNNETSSTLNTTSDKVFADPSDVFVLTSTTMLTLAESECDSLPYISFAKDTIPLCGGTSAYLFPDGITGMSNFWSTGEIGKDSILVSTPGTYKVTLTNLAGCSNSDSIVVINAPNPVVDYTVAPVCIGDTSKFNNITTITSGSMTYFWELGDVYTAQPDTVSDSLATIIYTNQGTYTSTLTATSNYGCTQSLSKSAVSLPYPVVDFTVYSECADSTLTIVNNSAITPSAGLLYRWDFGNGDTSILTTPSYAYDSIGTKNIQLQAVSNGCISTLTQSIAIHANPVTNFIASPVCIGTQTAFLDTTVVDSGTVASSYWTFQSGANSTLENPNYTFSSEGIYPVTLTTTSLLGCSHDTTINVIVNGLPMPSFTSNPTCMGDSVLFTNNSASQSNYNWNFNNEGTSVLFSPKFTFTTSGNKSIILTETDTNGCVGTISQSIISQPRPIANFALVSGCENTNLSFQNISSTPSGVITYEWDFNNGNTSTLTSPIESFTTANTYNVQLVADVGGCTDTVIQSITVNPNPIVNLGGVIATCANSYALDAQNAGATYLWSNNSTNQVYSPSYGGQYWVKVTNNFGCVVSDTVQLSLNSVVQPNLGVDATFCDETTLNAGYPGATYLWSDGSVAQDLNITTTGTYWVQVTDANNCVGNDTIVANVVNSVLPTLGSDQSECDGNITTLDPINMGSSYLWNTNEATATINITNTGVYWVDLTDANGCTSRDSIAVTYNSNPIVDLGNDGNYCDSALFDITQNNVTYLWENGSTTPIRTITNTGTYWAELTDNTSNCNSRDSITVTFTPRPIINLGNDTILCSGTDILLDAQNSSNGNTYSWNVTGTNQTLAVTSSGEYVSFVTTPIGCIGSDTINITVNAPINTFLGDDFVLCTGQTAELVSSIVDGSYEWYYNNDLLPEVTQTITASLFGSYVILATDTFGCLAVDTISLIEAPNAVTADFAAITLGLFEGDTIKFINLSSPSPFTSNWSFGDGSYSISEDEIHTYLFEGTYTVNLTVSNGICSSTVSKDLIIAPLTAKNEPQSEVDPSLNTFIKVLLYPNPNSGEFRLDIDLLSEGDLFIAFYGTDGQLLSTEQKLGKEFQLNYQMQDLAPGIYYIKLRVHEELKIIRFIKL